MKITKKIRNRVQRAMFDSVYKHNADLPNDERFLKAIVLSSDNFVDEAIKANPTAVRNYYTHLLEKEAQKKEKQKQRKGMIEK